MVVKARDLSPAGWAVVGQEALARALGEIEPSA
jgi:hypothetical protein